MRLWFYGIFMAWGMFLSIPCPFKKWDECARGHMLACLPFVGIIIGGLWALAAYLTALIGCPYPIRAAILFALPWLCSGFMHVDGYMDVCDAVLSRRPLEDRQRILKDPHCGAFSVICLVLLSIASYALFLSRELDVFDLLPLGMIPIAVRSCAAIAVYLLRPMKTSQYAKMSESKRVSLLFFPIVTLLAACVLPIILFGIRGFAPAAAAVGYAVFVFHGFRSLDGMNGDISGYALTLGELVGCAVLILVR